MLNRTIVSASLRRTAIAFALTGAALLGLQQSLAQSGSPFNTSGPVEYAADRIELQDRQNRVVLSGNVAIAQGNLRLQTGRATLSFTDNGSLQLQRLDATGGVVVTRGNESARGAVAVYDFNRRLITMSGGVALRRGSDTLNGNRLVIDLRSGLSSVDGVGSTGDSGRVTGTFTVPDN